jgi:hypothetical protein
MTTKPDPLQAAVAALAALADGRVPDHPGVLIGALALKSLCDRNPSPSRDLLDAAAGLEIVATGGSLDLDAAGRARAAHFAALVRQIAGAPAP